MATAFPIATYPLGGRTRFVDDHTIKRDVLDDGTMRVRVVGASTYRTISCSFEFISETVSAALEAYLITNRATEFDIPLEFGSPLTTYRGYFWSNATTSVTNGQLHTVTIQFRGAVV
jgi:hypothetical protein